ncbi:MAG: phosphodiester glycosidase family protein, partial [Candidatus Nanopelagicales bacterium]
TSPTVARAATVSSMVAGDPNAVVVLNGGTFNPSVPGIPDRVQISKGVVRKLVRQSYSNGLYGGIAIDSANKTITGAAFDLAGTFSTRAGSGIVGSVNWQTLPSQGIAVYTNAWGSRAHPAGTRAVVVAGTKVTKILTGSAATRRPATWEKYLTARTGTGAAALLAKVKVGDPATLWYGANGTTRYAGYPATAFSKPSGATGSGGAIVRDGAVDAPCSSRDEQPRPRSAIAWDAQGNMLVVAVAGKKFGSSWGGVSVHQFAGLLKQLGAVTAIRLDSGTSTTLWVRKTIGGKLVRLDRRSDDYQREVVDAVAFRAI